VVPKPPPYPPPPDEAGPEPPAPPEVIVLDEPESEMMRLQKEEFQKQSHDPVMCLAAMNVV